MWVDMNTLDEVFGITDSLACALVFHAQMIGGLVGRVVITIANEGAVTTGYRRKQVVNLRISVGMHHGHQQDQT